MNLEQRFIFHGLNKMGERNLDTVEGLFAHIVDYLQAIKYGPVRAQRLIMHIEYLHTMLKRLESLIRADEEGE